MVRIVWSKVCEDGYYAFEDHDHHVLSLGDVTDSDIVDCYMPRDADWVDPRYVNGVVVGAPITFDHHIVTYSLYENIESVQDDDENTDAYDVVVVPGPRIGLFEFRVPPPWGAEGGTSRGDASRGDDTHSMCLDKDGAINLHSDNPYCPPPILFAYDAVDFPSRPTKHTLLRVVGPYIAPTPESPRPHDVLPPSGDDDPSLPPEREKSAAPEVLVADAATHRAHGDARIRFDALIGTGTHQRGRRHLPCPAPKVKRAKVDGELARRSTWLSAYMRFHMQLDEAEVQRFALGNRARTADCDSLYIAILNAFDEVDGGRVPAAAAAAAAAAGGEKNGDGDGDDYDDYDDYNVDSPRGAAALQTCTDMRNAVAREVTEGHFEAFRDAYDERVTLGESTS